MAAVSPVRYYLRNIRAEGEARPTHASNVLYLKRRKQLMAKRMTAARQRDYPQSISEGVFNAALALIAIGVIGIAVCKVVEAYLAVRGAQ